MPLILVCDDDADIVNAIKIFLTSEGYEVITASDGDEALKLASVKSPTLVIMDVMMPVRDGVSAVKELRETMNIPVLFLSAKSEFEDRIAGLDAGGDDYLTKPFDPGELCARVRSLVRRYTVLGSEKAPDNDGKMSFGDVELIDAEKRVLLNGENVPLTPMEYDILKFLMSSPGKVFSPKEIFRAVRNEEPFGAENTIAVHIRHLREKLESDPASPRYIKVVWGRGYKFENE